MTAIGIRNIRLVENGIELEANLPGDSTNILTANLKEVRKNFYSLIFDLSETSQEEYIWHTIRVVLVNSLEWPKWVVIPKAEPQQCFILMHTDGVLIETGNRSEDTNITKMEVWETSKEVAREFVITKLQGDQSLTE
jgi:hypothetical protein